MSTVALSNVHKNLTDHLLRYSRQMPVEQDVIGQGSASTSTTRNMRIIG
jgi:hypothetical protein